MEEEAVKSRINTTRNDTSKSCDLSFDGRLVLYECISSCRNNCHNILLPRYLYSQRLFFGYVCCIRSLVWQESEPSYICLANPFRHHWWALSLEQNDRGGITWKWTGAIGKWSRRNRHCLRRTSTFSGFAVALTMANIKRISFGDMHSRLHFATHPSKTFAFRLFLWNEDSQSNPILFSLLTVIKMDRLFLKFNL